ncbi:hypothetical protein GH714_009896 [Hevea brasiliensis]|uniref:Ubiquitin-like domain-containing protein n=1 Tax=Hevea brasiliensis TaxID=3981 RepID=A0A6A6MML2_HEVBR|nr:hypothetical protein GH714_009896 [Hevea brasiliensis]
MDLDMESMSAVIGVSIPVLRFLLCFVVTIPVSFIHRLVPGKLGKHLFAALSGAFLSYLSFGFYSNLHFLVPMLLGYASMLLFRPYCGILTFILGFGYLIGCHVYYMSGDAWKEGGIDATGALMVLTLKVISCAINYNDGLLDEKELQESQKKNLLIKLPSLIEYFGYCLCCGSHFAGPVYEVKDYLEWTERKGIWAHTEGGPSPSPYGATIRALIQAAFCMALYLYLVPHFPLSQFTDPVYQEWGFWKRLSYQYMSGFTARWKYYFIWSISEASIIISGLGFSGWTDTSSPKTRWDRAKNVDILGVEFAKSSVELPLVWNIQGLYPGYIIFFVQSALMISGSRDQEYMKMDPMKSKMKGVFMPANKRALDGRANVNVEDLEIRPGGMLVQKRNSDPNQNSVPIPSIKVKVKYGSLSHQICVSSQASFGELKKILAEQTGVHPQDQKLIYKKKERDSKAYLDNAEKASKSLQQISLEVDELQTKVKALEATASGGEKVAEIDADNLTEILMNILVALDGIAAEGDLKLQKGMQERKVQKYIETLDMLKLQNSKDNSNEDKIAMQQQENSSGKMPTPMQKQPVRPRQKNTTVELPIQQQLLRHSESFVITTNWETFD